MNPQARIGAWVGPTVHEPNIVLVPQSNLSSAIYHCRTSPRRNGFDEDESNLGNQSKHYSGHDRRSQAYLVSSTKHNGTDI